MRSNRLRPIIPLRSSLQFVALVGCLIGMGPAPLLGRQLFRWAQTTRIDRRNRWQGLMAFALLGAVIYAGLWHFESPVHQLLPKLLLAFRTHNVQRVGMYLLALWLYDTLLTPFMAVLTGIPLACSAWLKRSRLFSQRGSHHYVKEAQDDEDVLTLTGVVSNLASLIQTSYPGNASLLPPAIVSANSLQVNGSPVIGRPLGGDLDWEKGGWFTFPLIALQEHGVICGGTGSGKTSLAIRLAAVASYVYGFRVYYVDSKADTDTAEQFVTAMEQQGVSHVRMFPHEPFDGWRGSSRDLRNRLMQLLTYSEHYYADGARLLLGLALDAPGGIPRSSAAFLKRLDREVLEELYRGTPRLSRLKRIPFVHIDGTMVRYESFFTTAGDLLDGTWAWEDTRAAYIGLDSLGQHDDTLALGRFFVEDFSHFIKYRKPPQERVLLILEEFSALSDSVEVTNLFERIRSAGGSVFVIAQGSKGLGKQGEKILQAASSIILFSGSDPDDLIHHAGTRLVPDFSHHLLPVRTGGAASTHTAGSTLRMREQPKIDPNEVRQLAKGQCFFIYKGAMQKVQVEKLPLASHLIEATQQDLGLEQCTSATYAASSPEVAVPQPLPRSVAPPVLAQMPQAEQQAPDSQKLATSTTTPPGHSKKPRDLFHS